MRPKPNWKKASKDQKDQFQSCLENELSSITIPQILSNCQDVQCDNPSHTDDADRANIEILECVEKAAYENLPVPSSSKQSDTKHKIPGWSAEVGPYRENANFWHQVWDSGDRPMNTELHRIMKKSRNIYHFQIRKLKRSQDMIKKNKLLDACLNSNSDLFKEIKKMRSVKPCVANSIDGVKDNIADHFKSVYEGLYNSVDDSAELVELCETVNSKVNFLCLHDVRKVTPDIVKEAASNLRDSKSDPTFNFSSDCVKNSPDNLFSFLSTIIQAFLIHGRVTLFLLLATLVPLVKDKLATLNDSKNYRSIAMSSLILKLLDWIILLLFGVSLGVDELQFAYQPGSSTSMCTWAAVETIDYFMRIGTEVYLLNWHDQEF